MTGDSNPLPPGALERALARDRRLIAVALVALVVLGWSYLLVLARQMSAGTLPSDAAMQAMPAMPDMPGMQMHADVGSTVRSFSLTALMWWTMMIGMMVPSAAPMILLFGTVQRRQLSGESPRLRVALFTGGYLATWAAFSLLAAAAQIMLTRTALLTPLDLTAVRWLAALLVALAGVYQLTPLKNVCLRRCRSPAEFLSAHWRRGNAGALRMGVTHGLFCVGCCWLLMALLFVVGVMNLFWVAVIAAFVLLEKLLPYGETTSKAAGIVLLLLAGYLALVS
jgi:predicted metal-binding membrane protein